MTHFRISEAAALVGVSDDTVRRWVGDGILQVSHDAAGRQVVDGAHLARHAQRLASAAEVGDVGEVRRSARNRFTGLVTKIDIDGLMAQVELQSGPHRLVSLMSREAADDLGLEPGVLAIASVKSTHVVIELPEQP